ncbi:MAG: hypothetical protein AAFN12_03530, partial [Cyanobacteria bacterium J06560_2]
PQPTAVLVNRSVESLAKRCPEGHTQPPSTVWHSHLPLFGTATFHCLAQPPSTVWHSQSTPPL